MIIPRTVLKRPAIFNSRAILIGAQILKVYNITKSNTIKPSILFLQFEILLKKQSGQIPEDLFEVVTVNTVCDCQGKEFWPVD